MFYSTKIGTVRWACSNLIVRVKVSRRMKPLEMCSCLSSMDSSVTSNACWISFYIRPDEFTFHHLWRGIVFSYFMTIWGNGLHLLKSALWNPSLFPSCLLKESLFSISRVMLYKESCMMSPMSSDLGFAPEVMVLANKRRLDGWSHLVKSFGRKHWSCQGWGLQTFNFQGQLFHRSDITIWKSRLFLQHFNATN